MAVRLLAFLVTLAALAGVALAGKEFQRVWTGVPTDREAPAQTAQTAQSPPTDAPRAERGDWPALFGEKKVEPPKPPEPPTPPAPPTPPVASLGYALSGTVARNGALWAILSHPTGGRILKVGDELEPGITVVDIDATGVWFETSRGREALEFAK